MCKFKKEIDKLAKRLTPYLKKAKKNCLIEVSYRYIDADTYTVNCEYVWVNEALPDYPPYNRRDSKLWVNDYGSVNAVEDNDNPQDAAETIAYAAFDERSRGPEEDTEYPIQACLAIYIDGKFAKEITA